MSPAPPITLAFLALPRAASEANPQSEPDPRRGRRPGPWTVAAREGRRRRRDGLSAAVALTATGMGMALLLDLEPSDLAPRPAAAAHAMLMAPEAPSPGRDEAMRP